MFRGIMVGDNFKQIIKDNQDSFKKLSKWEQEYLNKKIGRAD